MTNEEEMTNGFARIVLVQLNTDEQLNVREHEAIRMAIKALEQQTCEDAVSRQAVLDMCKKEIDRINKNWQNYHSPSEAKSGFVYITTNIYDLPPVKPQYTEAEIQKMQELEQAEIEKAYEIGKAEEPKTGHWIEYDHGLGAKYYRCSICKGFEDGEKGKYCKWCGAKMVEPQESEVSEC